MALELRIAGPGLDLSRRLAPGDPALILGRDPDCNVCLPDPARTVSRRHLSVWNEGGQLHFHVLSVVNGVELAGAELGPGARGVLLPQQELQLSTFRLQVTLVQDESHVDPWILLEREAAAVQPRELPAEEDPFGDWGFESTFGSGQLEADALAPATDLRPFLRGLGLEPGQAAALTVGELETLGRATRLALQSLLRAIAAADRARADLGAGDRTMVQPREANPLRLDSPLEAKLKYLAGGRATAPGWAAPDAALAELAGELVAHQEALRLAVREALEGTLEEFAPEALRQRLLGDGPRLFEAARAWDAFAKDYARRRQELPVWVHQLLEQHFASAYLREFMRLKADTGEPTR